MGSNKKIFILLFCLFVIIICGILYLNLRKKSLENNSELVVNKNENVAVVQNNVFNKSDYEVVLKNYLGNNTKADIYLKDKDGEVEKFFMSVEDMDKSIVRPAEFYRGNLYILKKIVMGDVWYNELWKYNTKKEGKKIYSAKGMVFTILKERGEILLNKTVSDIDTKAIVIIDLNGNVVIGFERPEIYTYTELNDDLKKSIDEDSVFINISNVSNNYIYFKTEMQNLLLGITKLDLSSMSIEKNDLSKLYITGQDYSINKSNNKIVFSTYPQEFDISSANVVENKIEDKIYLNYYDLNTKDKIAIATVSGKKFQPIWYNDSVFSYITDNGSRIKKNIAEILK